MSNKVRIIIIGGGFAGVFTAKNLLKQLNKKQLANVEIELVSNRNYFVFQPLLPEVSSGIINPHDAVSPLRALLPKIKHRLATVKKIDPKVQKIEVLQGRHKKIITLNYDQLIIACGQKSNLNLPGFASHTYTMKNLGDAFCLRNHILKCLELADVTLNKQIKKHALTFVITGAGFSGVETAGELQDMVQKALKYYPNISLDETQFIVLQKDERILTQLTETLATYAHQKLTKRGVDIRLNTGVVQASNDHVSLDTGEKIHTHTVITTIGSGPRGFISRHFALQYGRIPVNKQMQSTQYDNIWALGDVALIPLDKQKSGMEYAPLTAQFAVREAEVIAQNIKAKLFTGRLQDFNFRPLGLMASLGAYQGVMEIRKIILSGIVAWLMWRSIYVTKLPGFTTKLRVLINWVMDYLFPRTLVQVSPVQKRSVREEYYTKDDIIHYEGEIITHFSLIISGEVAVHDQAGDSHTLGVQDNLCQNSEQMQYNNTFTATKDTIIMTIPWQEFLLLKENFDKFGAIFADSKS